MLALGFFGASAIPMAARAADFPRAGVICDAPRQVCFDRQGPSIGLTRIYYGPDASNRLLAQLSRSPPQREFQLSSGQLCDLKQQLCWDGGWRRRNVNPLLSRQLFGLSPTTGPAMGTAPAPQPPPAGERQCQLVLSDATGTWPVFIVDRGSAVQFRWSNLLLDVSRSQQARGGGPDGVVPPTPTPRSTGETGQDLLDDIFP
jgi:hypothetical protein